MFGRKKTERFVAVQEKSPPIDASPLDEMRAASALSAASPVHEMRVFTTGATRDSDAGKYDYEGFLSPRVLRRYAQYMHEHRRQADGQMRASDNWQRGIPRSQYMKSMWRHFMDVWTAWRSGYFLGKVVEDALCALLFNVMGMLHETVSPPVEAKDEYERAADAIATIPEEEVRGLHPQSGVHAAQQGVIDQGIDTAP